MMSAGLHVAHVIRSLEIGGMERLVHELTSHRPEGTTSIICLERKGHFGEELEREGFPVRVVGTDGSIAQRLWRLRRAIADLKPDVLHCHNLLALTHAGLLSSARCAPRLLTTKHGNSLPAGGRMVRVMRFLARRNRMVAVSLEVERNLREWCRSTRFPVTVIPNGISAEAFNRFADREQVRHRLGYERNHLVLGTVARLVADKDHSTLLKAFRKLHFQAPEARLAVIGDGPLRSRLEGEAAELGIAELVSFLGERHDVPELLSGLDVFVLSSRTEGLPMTILEAMAAGLPIVASRVGGIPTTVEDGITGRLCEVGSPEALAEAAWPLLRDEGSRQKMGKAGRRKLEREFSVSQTAARYEEIYHSL